MKSTQVSDLDNLLEEQKQPTPPSIGLRFQKKSATVSLTPCAEMDATLKAVSEEEKAKKFASRIAVDLIAEINQTDFRAKIKEPKWSEKVAALDILIMRGGVKPYKLCQPTASIDYCPLIRDLKQLLGHTHFAVKSKALIALGMLAEGVGEKLFSYLKPLLYSILELSKDKKVNQASYGCLDSFFGNVIGFENLLAKEDSIPSAVNEKAHPLVRKGALEFVRRCIERADTAGPRGSINEVFAESIIQVCRDKLNDQDAGVRQEACHVLKSLLKTDNSGIKAVTERQVIILEKEYPRAYKTLIQATSDASVSGTTYSKKTSLPKARKVLPTKKIVIPKASRKISPLKQGGQDDRNNSMKSSSKAGVQKKLPQRNETKADFAVDVDEGNAPSVEDSCEFLSKLNIPNWDAAEDADGILSGLKSTNWTFRKEAIDSLASFLRSNVAKTGDPNCSIHALVFLKSCTKNFKENNLNLIKALIEIFIAVCDLYLSLKRQLEVWICEAAIILAVGKISDKKLSAGASKLLISLCEVQIPEVIITLSIKVVKSTKSPLPREGLLTWCKIYCDDFGASTLRKGLHNCVNWALEECGGTNVKIKTAALVLIREMHTQLGPVLKALVMSNSGLESSTRTQVESLLVSSPFDPTSAKASRQRKSFVEEGSHDGEGLPSLAIDIPKTDLVATLPSKCLTRMAAKEGLIAWKIRKEALDEVESACLQFTGVLSTTPNCMKSLIELCRALKERLTDLQSNLKPLAARNIAHVLRSVDSVSQAKLARIVCGPLIYAAMNDNKKLMRDASLDALEKCTDKMDIEGGGANPLAMKSFMTAVLSEIGDSEYKAIGLPSVLGLAVKKAEHFPHLDSISTSKGKTLEKQFAAMTVACLTSSKTETRSVAESLLGKCVKFGTLNPRSIENGVQKLTQAEQRHVRIILNSLGIDGTQKSANLHASASSRRINPSKQSSSPCISVKDKKSTGSERTPAKPTARIRRDSHKPLKRGGNSSSDTLNDLLSDPHFFPLISNNGLTSTKDQRTSISSRNRDPWPEYPEEPSGKDLLKNLRQIWSPLLPASSIGILFPSGGIVRQDNVLSGCALISHALTVLQANGQEHILIDQLDLVNKWLAFGICSRESTVGMQAIIPFILKLFSLLRKSQYQMTDTESGMLLPYILEKAGVAKERFRDMLLDLLASLASDDIYPLVKYGSITCISVIESSTSPKTRVLAAHQCHSCVEKCGLIGIGKKGVQLVAKSLSNEKHTENRTAYLDLIEMIIQKMNGDINKYIKICGSSTLSRRARELVEERWMRHKNAAASSTTKMRPSTAQPRPTKSPTQGMLTLYKSISTSAIVSASELLHALPSLNLETATNGRSNDDAVLTSPSSNDRGGPSTFSSKTPEYSSSENKTKAYSSHSGTGVSAPLRERMRKISEQRQAEKMFNAIMCDVDDLLSQPTPLGDKENISLIAVTGLSRIHASLTAHGTIQTETGQVVLDELRIIVKANLPYCVARLTSVLGFGFRCGTALKPDGLSTPLFSVSIAGLMAIFLDPALSVLIPEEVLILVIRRAASGLLDRRLAGNLKGSNHGLNASTVVKIAKAINKLAIQATLGVTRHVSLQSLLSLQLQICSACVKEGVAITDVSNIHNRTSRIITKLFSRVIQIEESEALPFAGTNMDLLSLFGSLEGFLLKARSVKGLSVSFPQSTSRGVVDHSFVCDDRMVPLLTMGRDFMLHLLKAKDSQDKLESVKDVIVCLGLSEVSLIRRLFCNCCDELGLGDILGNSQSTGYDEDKLSELILAVGNFAVGNAEEEEDRMYAFDDLREFVCKHEQIDIEDELSSLSVSFRKYVLDELTAPTPFRPPLSTDSRSLLSGYSGESSNSAFSVSDAHILKTTRSLLSTYSDDSSRSLASGCSFDIDSTVSAAEAMAERVRKLKSKINAVKATAQSMINVSVVK